MRGRVLGGDRRVWTAAAAAGAIVLALAAWQMLLPRELLTGTNSTVAKQPFTLTATGERLCVPEVALPAGTRRVEIALSTDVPRPGIAMQLRSGGETVRADVPGPDAPGQQNYIVELPRTWPERLDEAPAEVCVWATGTPFTLLGAAGFTDPPSTLGGQPLTGRIALWFRGPAGERHSYLSQLPEMFERAARFRPGVVGPWTYWLWLLALPVLWIAGLRLIARGGASTTRRTALAVGAIAFVNIAGWALISPPFDTPDEQEHFTYVQNVAEKQVDPRQGPPEGILSPEASIAMDATRVFTYYATPIGRPPWTALDERRWRRAADVEPRPSREPPGIASPSATQLPPFLGPLAPASYGLLPPGYYALSSPAYLVAREGSTFTQLTAVRLWSALLGALTAAIAVLLVLELLPGRRALAAAAGLLVGFQPMFGFISGSANSDNGVNLMAALILLLTVRILRRGMTLRTGIALAVALVAAPMMKTTGYSLTAVALFGLAAALWRARRAGTFRPAPWVATAGTFLALHAIWVGIARWQVGPPPESLASANPDTVRAGITGQLSYLWQVLLPRLPFMTDLIAPRWPDYGYSVWVERVWGSYGWLAIEFPPWVYRLFATGCALVLAAGAAALVRRRELLRTHGAEIALLVFTPLLVIAAVHAGLVSLSPRVAPPEQGRYLFPAITALAALAVGATGLLRREWRPAMAAAMVALVMGAGFAGQLFWLSNAYA